MRTRPTSSAQDWFWPKGKKHALSYEDQLYVWCLLLRNKLAGKIAPAHPKDNRALEYALLIPEQMAVDEINATTDVSVTRRDLVAIVGEFADQAPPYPSTEPAPIKYKPYLHSGGGKKLRKSQQKQGRFWPKSWIEGRPTSAFGYVLVNGVPQWNNGAHTLHLKSVRKAA